MASGVCDQRLAPVSWLQPRFTAIPKWRASKAAQSATATRPHRLKTLRTSPGSKSDAGHTRGSAVGSHEAEQVEDLMPEPLKDSPQRSAALHDFCMVIPYGLILLAAGTISLFTGAGWSGGRTFAAGCLTLGLGNTSLQLWRSGNRTRLVTFFTAGIAAAVTAAKFQRTRMVQVPWVRWSNFGLSGISAAMVLFLCYNILAGGNPLKPAEDVQEEGDTEALPERPLP
ncbi:hypothetical protein WJX74_009676 [Apatococcus lobatus]|uniref:Uncharacterized protein n=2 Tax=Apatococcus TaxID=904362 RepID=A0AAW1TBE9_9CHLO